MDLPGDENCIESPLSQLVQQFSMEPLHQLSRLLIVNI